MKKLFTLVFCIVSFSLRAQYYAPVLTFDTGDTLYSRIITVDTINYHHNIWQVGAPHKSVFNTAHSLTNVMVTDTASPYAANDTSVFILKIAKLRPYSPTSISMGEFHRLHFYYQLDIDSNAIARLEISDDSGAHWINIKDPLPSGYFWNSTPADLSLSTSGWTDLDLTTNWSGYYDSTFFRFTFISDSNTAAKEGWMIDDIQFEYVWEGIAQIQNDNLISIYPNPTKGNIYIHSGKTPTGNTALSVYNLQGQEVYKADKVTQNCYINLPLPQGMYTLRYTQGDEYCVKKILIEN